MNISRKRVTEILSDMMKEHINYYDDRSYCAREVTFDYATEHPIKVDFIKFKPLNNFISGIEKGDFYCYEIKSCVDDFHSKNGHNFIGDYNYYVMPEDVYNAVKDEIPYDIRVYCPELTGGDEWYWWISKSPILTCKKKAKRRNRKKSLCEMLFMIWRSYKRDVNKEELRCKNDK